MSNPILPKHSNVDGKSPITSDLILGEIAVNNYNGRMFVKINDGTDSIVEIGGDVNIDGGSAAATFAPSDHVYDGGGA